MLRPPAWQGTQDQVIQGSSADQKIPEWFEDCASKLCFFKFLTSNENGRCLVKDSFLVVGRSKKCWRIIRMAWRLANWAMWPLWILSLSMMLLLKSQKMTGLVRSVQMQAICVHKFHETNWLRRVSPYFSRKLHYRAGSWKWPFRNSFFFHHTWNWMKFLRSLKSNI